MPGGMPGIGKGEEGRGGDNRTTASKVREATATL